LNYTRVSFFLSPGTTTAGILAQANLKVNR